MACLRGELGPSLISSRRCHSAAQSRVRLGRQHLTCCRKEPHTVRDVLAIHSLKQTGSYEQASYANEDAATTVAAQYGRFLPQDTAAVVAQVLNQAWLD